MRILDFSGVLGAVAPKDLGRSPYKICELGLSSLKASKILEFPKNSRIPKPCVIPRLDRGISSNRRHCEEAKNPPSLRGVSETNDEAIS